MREKIPSTPQFCGCDIILQNLMKNFFSERINLKEFAVVDHLERKGHGLLDQSQICIANSRADIKKVKIVVDMVKKQNKC